MNLTVEIHEKEWPIVVAAAKKARTTPERYVQRLFNAGLDARHPEAWGNEPHDDAQTLIALACAGLPDITRIAKAMRCPPERVERILSAWDHVLSNQTGAPVEEAETIPEEPIDAPLAPVPATVDIEPPLSTGVAEAENSIFESAGSGQIDGDVNVSRDCIADSCGNDGPIEIPRTQNLEIQVDEEAQEEEAIDPDREPEADKALDETCASAQGDKGSARQETNGRMGQEDFEDVRIFESNPVAADHTVARSILNHSFAGFPGVGKHSSETTEIHDSVSSDAVEDAPALSVSPFPEVPAPAAAPVPPAAVKAIRGAAASKFDRFAALKVIADTDVPPGVLTDDEMTVFIAFAEAIEPRDRAESFPITGKAKRALVEKEAEEAFEYLIPAFRAIQRAGLVILAAQAFSPAPYFGYTITPAGAAVILEALGYGD